MLKIECLSGGLIGAAALLAASPSLALECPVPHARTEKHVLRETPTMISVTGRKLAQGGTKTAEQVIADLRARHPTATSSEIMNFLVTAYCPAINERSDISEAQKRKKVETFDRQMGTILFH